MGFRRAFLWSGKGHAEAVFLLMSPYSSFSQLFSALKCHPCWGSLIKPNNLFSPYCFCALRNSHLSFRALLTERAISEVVEITEQVTHVTYCIYNFLSDTLTIVFHLYADGKRNTYLNLQDQKSKLTWGYSLIFGYQCSDLQNKFTLRYTAGLSQRVWGERHNTER